MRNENLDQGYIDKLDWIERAWKPALDEIIQPYIDLNREPSDAVLDAFGSILGASHNEVRKLIARRAQASGSTLLSQWV